MTNGRLARLRQTLVRLFPDRQIYLRSEGEMRAFVFSTRRQMVLASAVGFLGLWTLFASGSLVLNALALTEADRDAAQRKAYYERLIADRQARLASAVEQLSDTTGSVDGLAQRVESRHAALASLLSDFKEVPGAAEALAPKPLVDVQAAAAAPEARIQMVRLDQERLITLAESFAKTRAERLRLAFRMAGINPGSVVGAYGRGGPLTEAKDPRALAAVLDVDEDFARRVQRASANLAEMRALTDAAATLPFGTPVDAARRTSNFGGRSDPFTSRAAFHPGVDFGGGMLTPIRATGPGVVSFTGVRSGYGNTVEIDHGHGLKTRYAHLAGFAVRPGQRVAVGQRIASMGSTGRSTGPHLHYEVWVDGRVQNPDRFLKAGEHVHEAG